MGAGAATGAPRGAAREWWRQRRALRPPARPGPGPTPRERSPQGDPPEDAHPLQLKLLRPHTRFQFGFDALGEPHRRHKGVDAFRNEGDGHLPDAAHGYDLLVEDVG